MSPNDLLFFGGLTAVLIAAGIQDWRSREVSNWITLPLFAAGLIAYAWRIFTDPLSNAVIAVGVVIILLIAAAWRDWMGGADFKILVGLFGLWPLAGVASLFAALTWGIIEIVSTRDQRAHMPAVSAFALAVTLTFFAEVFTMLAIHKV